MTVGVAKHGAALRTARPIFASHVFSGGQAVPSGREPVRMSCQLGLSQSSQPSKLLAARYIDLVSSEREPRDIPGVQVGGAPPMNVLDVKSSSNILECTRHTFRYCLA